MFHKKFKLARFITLLAILAISIASCAQATPAPEGPVAPEASVEEPRAEQTAITFWSGLGSPENVVMAALVRQFNEVNEYGITIELTELDWGTLYSKIVLDYKTDNAPDVMTMHQTNILQNVELGILQPVGDLATEAGLTGEDFVNTAWEGTQVDMKRYAIPLDLHPIGLFYNVDMFEAAGLDPNRPPTNAEELLDYAKKLTVDTNGDGNIDQYGFAMGYSGGIPFRVWMSLVWQHTGADILNSDGTQAIFNNQAGIESLQFLHDLIYVEGVTPQAEQDPDDDFMKGLVAMNITGPWAMGDFNKIEGLNYRTAMVPVIYDQPAAWGNSHTFVFPGNDEPVKTAAAMKFVKWMSDQNFEWSRDAGHMPVRESVLTSDQFKTLENWQAFANTLPYAHYYPAIVRQAEVFGREATSPFVIMMESVMLGQTTTEDAIARAEEDVNRILAAP